MHFKHRPNQMNPCDYNNKVITVSKKASLIRLFNIVVAIDSTAADNEDNLRRPPISSMPWTGPAKVQAVPEAQFNMAVATCILFQWTTHGKMEPLILLGHNDYLTIIY